MQEVIRYIADDGTEFEYEDDCLTYEWGIKTKGASYTLLGRNYEVLNNAESVSYEDCWYIFLPSEKSAQQINDVWDYNVIGMEAPRFLWGKYYHDMPNLGLWAYEEDNNTWYHVGNRMKELETMANKCMDAINGGI